jgi:hypothetical protein
MLYHFKTASPVPVSHFALSQPALALTFAPKDKTAAKSIIVLNDEFEFIEVGLGVPVEAKKKHKIESKIQADENLLVKMYGNLKATEFEKLPENGRKQFEQVKFLDAPSHMLPASSKLLVPHFKSILTRRLPKADESAHVDAEEMDIDEPELSQLHVVPASSLDLEFMGDVLDVLSI